MCGVWSQAEILSNLGLGTHWQSAGLDGHQATGIGSPIYGDISANTYQACQMKVGHVDGGFGIYNYCPNEVFNMYAGGGVQTRLSFYLKNKSPTNPTDLTGLLGGAEWITPSLRLPWQRLRYSQP